MGSVGDAYDNAMAESFFATLECELLDRRRFKTHTEARIALFEFIEGFYNPRRRHSSLGYLSPATFETRALDPGALHACHRARARQGRPGNIEPSRTVNMPAILDRRFSRQPSEHAGRDEKMIQAKPKDATEKEDKMPSDQTR